MQKIETISLSIEEQNDAILIIFHHNSTKIFATTNFSLQFRWTNILKQYVNRSKFKTFDLEKNPEIIFFHVYQNIPNIFISTAPDILDIGPIMQEFTKFLTLETLIQSEERVRKIEAFNALNQTSVSIVPLKLICNAVVRRGSLSCFAGLNNNPQLPCVFGFRGNNFSLEASGECLFEKSLSDLQIVIRQRKQEALIKLKQEEESWRVDMHTNAVALIWREIVNQIKALETEIKFDPKMELKIIPNIYTKTENFVEINEFAPNQTQIKTDLFDENNGIIPIISFMKNRIFSGQIEITLQKVKITVYSKGSAEKRQERIVKVRLAMNKHNRRLFQILIPGQGTHTFYVTNEENVEILLSLFETAKKLVKRMPSVRNLSSIHALDSLETMRSTLSLPDLMLSQRKNSQQETRLYSTINFQVSRKLIPKIKRHFATGRADFAVLIEHENEFCPGLLKLHKNFLEITIYGKKESQKFLYLEIARIKKEDDPVVDTKIAIEMQNRSAVRLQTQSLRKMIEVVNSLEMFKWYFGTDPENIAIHGEIIGTQLEIEAIAERVAEKKYATFFVSYAQQSTAKERAILRIAYSSLSLVSAVTFHTVISLTPHSPSQISISFSEESSVVLYTSTSAKYQPLTIFCNSKSQKNLIEICYQKLVAIPQDKKDLATPANIQTRRSLSLVNQSLGHQSTPRKSTFTTPSLLSNSSPIPAEIIRYVEFSRTFSPVVIQSQSHLALFNEALLDSEFTTFSADTLVLIQNSLANLIDQNNSKSNDLIVKIKVNLIGKETISCIAVLDKKSILFHEELLSQIVLFQASLPSSDLRVLLDIRNPQRFAIFSTKKKLLIFETQTSQERDILSNIILLFASGSSLISDQPTNDSPQQMIKILTPLAEEMQFNRENQKSRSIFSITKEHATPPTLIASHPVLLVNSFGQRAEHATIILEPEYFMIERKSTRKTIRRKYSLFSKLFLLDPFRTRFYIDDLHHIVLEFADPQRRLGFLSDFYSHREKYLSSSFPFIDQTPLIFNCQLKVNNLEKQATLSLRFDRIEFNILDSSSPFHPLRFSSSPSVSRKNSILRSDQFLTHQNQLSQSSLALDYSQVLTCEMENAASSLVRLHLGKSRLIRIAFFSSEFARLFVYRFKMLTFIYLNSPKISTVLFASPSHHFFDKFLVKIIHNAKNRSRPSQHIMFRIGYLIVFKQNLEQKKIDISECIVSVSSENQKSCHLRSDVDQDHFDIVFDDTSQRDIFVERFKIFQNIESFLENYHLLQNENPNQNENQTENQTETENQNETENDIENETETSEIFYNNQNQNSNNENQNQNQENLYNLRKTTQKYNLEILWPKKQSKGTIEYDPFTITFKEDDVFHSEYFISAQDFHIRSSKTKDIVQISQEQKNILFKFPDPKNVVLLIQQIKRYRNQPKAKVIKSPFFQLKNKFVKIKLLKGKLIQFRSENGYIFEMQNSKLYLNEENMELILGEEEKEDEKVVLRFVTQSDYEKFRKWIK
ncbi:hypothetical protein M0811_05474 [Anaeramoeba ignava]|uniref:Uncharacterized protein n=1 Tax=Anaeramoeba ignava TaxID=1746090 RepID=A0A9Q0RF54_ANAIG|nr:hypothetical protein M0811_05474 [Anaeramoeba ignava]